MTKAAVVIPTYKETLNDFEKISLMQVRKILGDYPIIFVAPEGKNFKYFFEGSKVVHFPQQFFQSKNTYNALMLSPNFYQAFMQYEYILIYQTDAFVFSNKLEYFCSLGYDYIGAFWPYVYTDRFLENKRPKVFEVAPPVGNGGFSLRNVKAHYKLLTDNPSRVSRWLAEGKAEDLFFGYYGSQQRTDFHTAPINIAYAFAAEAYPKRCVKKNGGELPFGAHSWHNYSPDFYISIFEKYGYDMRPLRDKWKEWDKAGWINRTRQLAFARLNRRLQHHQPLNRYLPQNQFASIRVIRSPFAMTILTRLLMENINISDRIYFYNENEQAILMRDLKNERKSKFVMAFGDSAENFPIGEYKLYNENEQEIMIRDLNKMKLPHLLISSNLNIDDAIVEVAAKNKISVVAFLKSYLNRCEDMINQFGKN